MKSVALFIRSFNLGGAEKQSILLADYLRSEYIVYLIAFYSKGSLINYAINHNINIISFKGNFFVKLINFYFFLVNHNIFALVNYSPINNIIGCIIGKIAKVSIIFGGIRGSNTNKNRFKMVLQKYLLNKFSDSIISNSHKGAEKYVQYGYLRSKIHVIHNATNIDSLAIKQYSPISEKVHILSVGRFIWEKDYSTAIEAINNLRIKAGNVFNYTIIGHGHLKNDILNLIHKYNLSDIVSIYDNIGHPEIEKYYINTNIFLLTSIHEGMPNTIMEAMNFRLPIVTTNAGDTEYLVSNGKNGYVLNVGDYAGISDRLNELLQNKEKRISFGLNSFKILENNFTPDKIFIKYIDLINYFSQ